MANAVLGWKTYAKQLETALGNRGDLTHLVLYRRPQRHLMQFARRHADRRIARLVRPFDPIKLFAGAMGHDIRKAVSDFQPDVVHFAAHWPASALSALSSPPPFTLALDATRPGLTRDLPLPGWSERECANEADLFKAATHLFPMSHWVEDSLINDFDLARHQMTVQPPSLSQKNWPKQAMFENECIPNVLFVGNDLKRKGAYRLARWIAEPLRGRCHLHIVSTDTSTISGDGITFHGRVPHARLIEDLLPRMDIFCLPTKLDMSPFVIAEAAAAGLPVVASAIGGIPDMVEHSISGFLVPPEDEHGFISALSQLIDDKNMRRRMGSNSAKLAKARFSGEENFNNLIDKLIDISDRGVGYVS
ncbi:MAG: glycosyltransferase family 4 protein [Rhodobacteraceae bacterium]|nr:glycosyltransferase family 4 protein [Paracoccaceae bacterium]